jgi:hypothetical protein
MRASSSKHDHHRSFLLPLLLVLVFALSACSSILYYPDHQMHFRPEAFGLKVQELEFKAADGTRLCAWYLPAKTGSPAVTLLQFHGNAQNMTSHYLSVAWLVEHGVDVVTFDYRGYGNSEGRPEPMGLVQDGVAALNLAWDLHRKSGARSFVVVGQSLGGAVAMRALEDFAHRDEVALTVMDSTFVNYRSVAARKLAQNWLTAILSPVGYLAMSNVASAERSLEKHRTPLLVVHDRHDPIIPFALGEYIYERASSPKGFWVADLGRHVGSFAADEKARRERFWKLLNALPDTTLLKSE